MTVAEAKSLLGPLPEADQIAYVDTSRGIIATAATVSDVVKRDLARAIAAARAQFNVTQEQILGTIRTDNIAFARHSVAFALRQCGHSYPVIAGAMGKKSHGAAMNSVTVAGNRAATSQGFRNQLNAVVEAVRK